MVQGQSSVAAHSVRHGMHFPACHSEQSEESVPPSPCLPPLGEGFERVRPVAHDVRRYRVRCVWGGTEDRVQ